MNRHKSEKQDHGTDDQKSRVSLDPDWYEVNRNQIAVIMGIFFLRYLNFIYSEFEGDFVLCMVLGEIANHNISGFYSKQGSCVEIQKKWKKYPGREKHLKPTNAFSISEATGIPRETVRRKIEKLRKLGWIVKSHKGDVHISGTVSDHFTKGFNKKLLAELFEANDCLRKL